MRIDNVTLFIYSDHPICYDVTPSLVILILRVLLSLTPLVTYEQFITLPTSESYL